MEWLPIVKGTIASLIGTMLFVLMLPIFTKMLRPKMVQPTYEELKREKDIMGSVVFFSVIWVPMVFPRIDLTSFVGEWFVIVYAACLCLAYLLARLAFTLLDRKKSAAQGPAQNSGEA